MMGFCPNIDCNPGCGNAQGNLLFEALSSTPLHATVRCPACGTEMITFTAADPIGLVWE